jgi:hypothetical protein
MGKPKRMYTRLLEGETLDELVERMARTLIEAINEDRASRGEPPLPEKDPKK